MYCVRTMIAGNIAVVLAVVGVLIAVINNPYRDDYSVGPDALEFVRDRVINIEPLTR